MPNSTTTELWDLAMNRPVIDAERLARAVEEQVRRDRLDYRDTLLVRRVLESLREFWGPQRYDRWFESSEQHDRLDFVSNSPIDPIEHKESFPYLKERIMSKTTPHQFESYLQELSVGLFEKTRLVVGGSAAMILHGLLERQTGDIDVVDEVPKVLRDEHSKLDDLARRYGLLLTHFQSHYLPTGWQDRTQFHQEYDNLEVHLIDIHDFFVGKLFSKRTKDLDDLRELSLALDKETITRRLAQAVNLLGEESLRQAAQKNWRILYVEPLPVGTS